MEQMNLARYGHTGRVRTAICGMLVFLLGLAAALCGSAHQALATEASGPQASKELASNGDGTYYLNLSVTGSATSTTQKSKANVVLVMDTSGSMEFHEISATGCYGFFPYWGHPDPDDSTMGKLYKKTGSNRYVEIKEGEEYAGTLYYRDDNRYEEYTGDRYSSETRLDVAQSAATSLVNSLAANNADENDDTIEFTLESFAGYADTGYGSGYGTWYHGDPDSDDIEDLIDAIDDLYASGGTNWDDALHDATSVAKAKNDGDPVYYIFLSDGDPTFHMNASHTQRFGTGSSTSQNDLDAAYTEADAIKTAGYLFYGVGAFGNVSNMQTLANRAGGKYYSASNKEALVKAFDDIVKSITSAESFKNVKITDGLTAATSSVVLEAGATPSDFGYTIKEKGKYGDIHTVTLNDDGTIATVNFKKEDLTITDDKGASLTLKIGEAFPVATVNSGTVTWDITKFGTLLDGFTYSVQFMVWPSQEAYDTVAALQNGTLEWNDVKNKDQYVRTLDDDGAYTYELKTNTSAKVDYTAEKKVDGKVVSTRTGTSKIKDAPSMPLTSTTMTVEKAWIGQQPPSGASVEMALYIDGTASGKTVTLDASGSWKGTVYVAPGLIVDNHIFDNETLEAGHDYKLAEVSAQGMSIAPFTFTTETVHPMLVSGVYGLQDTQGGDMVLTGTNTYTTTPGTLDTAEDVLCNKTVEGTGFAEKTFDFTMTPCDANGAALQGAESVPGSATFDEAGTATVDFGEITYDEPGTYYYKIVETTTNAAGWTMDNAAAGKLAVVTVTDNGQGQLVPAVSTAVSFTNSYRAAATTCEAITARKVLENQDLAAGAFSFSLADADGEVVKTAVNDAAGNVSFGMLEFSAAGTYTYTMTEDAGTKDCYTYDDTAHTVTVTVTDNGVGQLVASVTGNGPTFTNTYTASSDQVYIEGVKNVNGQPATEDIFEFAIEAEDGAPLPATTTVTNVGGTWSFGPIVYDESVFEEESGPDPRGTEPGGNNARTAVFEYTITEVAGSAGGYTYDSHAETVCVTVTDDGEGNLETSVAYEDDGAVFDNGYEAAGTAVINATKKLDGAELGDGQFQFELIDAATGEKFAQASNDGDGAIEFGVNYTLDAQTDDTGTHTYIVREVNEGQTGYTYDASAKTVVVTVRDSGDGTLGTSVETDGELQFQNSYAPLPTDVELSAQKVLQVNSGSRELVEGEFEFAITDAEGEVVSTGVNDAEGKIAFGKIPVTEPGVHTFTVMEEAGDAEGITYDMNTYEYAVTVVDKDGKLTVVEGADYVPTFTNVYDEPVEPPAAEEPEEPEADEPAEKAAEKPAPTGVTAKTGDTVNVLPIVVLALAAAVAVLGIRRRNGGTSGGAHARR